MVVGDGTSRREGSTHHCTAESIAWGSKKGGTFDHARTRLVGRRALPLRPEHEISIPSHDLGSNQTDRYKDLERGGISREVQSSQCFARRNFDGLKKEIPPRKAA